MFVLLTAFALAATGAPSDSKSETKDPIVCKSIKEAETGSNMRRKTRQCKLKSVWQAEERAGRQEVQAVKHRMGDSR